MFSPSGLSVVTFTGMSESIAHEFGGLFFIPEDKGIVLRHISIHDLNSENCGDVVVSNDSLGPDCQLAPAVIQRIKSIVGKHVPVIVKCASSTSETPSFPDKGEFIVKKNIELMPLLRRILVLSE